MTKEDKKTTKYSPLVKKIRWMHQLLTKILPLMVGCSGVVWSVGGFFERSWDSRCVRRNACLCSQFGTTTLIL